MERITAGAYPTLDEMKAHYTRGGLGDMKCKKLLTAILNETLEPLRQRRREYEQDIAGVCQILQEGSMRARETAAETMDMVRRAMRIDYFQTPEFVEEMKKKYS